MNPQQNVASPINQAYQFCQPAGNGMMNCSATPIRQIPSNSQIPQVPAAALTGFSAFSLVSPPTSTIAPTQTVAFPYNIVPGGNAISNPAGTNFTLTKAGIYVVAFLLRVASGSGIAVYVNNQPKQTTPYSTPSQLGEYVGIVNFNANAGDIVSLVNSGNTTLSLLNGTTSFLAIVGPSAIGQ